jgi:Cu-Zn family superoxide dismutase
MKNTLVFPLLLLLTLAPLGAPQSPITQYPLPADVTYPEGVADDAKANALCNGSAATGTVVRMDLASRKVDVVAPAGAALPGEPFPALLGMKVDAAGRLWLAGGRTGAMAVVDSRKGTVLKKFAVPSAATPSLINDVTIVGSSAYFTDSLTPMLWRVAVKGDQIGELEPWLTLAAPLEYTSPGANLNGITATPDGKHLIVVQMNKGLLFRIGVDDKRITPIDVGGESLTAADGLVLDGQTLYVVRQGEQEIVTVALEADLSRGRVVSRFKDPALMWPATAVKVGDQLLVVNTQFNKRTTKDPQAPFSIIGVPLARLQGK